MSNGNPECPTCRGEGETLSFDAAPGGVYSPCVCSAPYFRGEYFDREHPEYVGQTFVYDENNRAVVALMALIVKEYQNGQRKTGGGLGAYLYGLAGRGKTWPSWIAARKISTDPPYPLALILHHPTWINRLRATHGREYEGRPYEVIMKEAQKTPVLLIDDFAGGQDQKNPKPPTDYAQEQTYLLIEERLKFPHLVTFITSNLGPRSWGSWGGRTESRLHGLTDGRRIHVKGHDRRKKENQQ